MAGQASGNLRVGVTIGKVSSAEATRTYTWGAAAVSVKQAGYGNVERVGKSDRLYWFTGTFSGGSFRIAVSIASGEAVEVIPA